MYQEVAGGQSGLVPALARLGMRGECPAAVGVVGDGAAEGDFPRSVQGMPRGRCLSARNDYIRGYPANTEKIVCIRYVRPGFTVLQGFPDHAL